MAKRLQRNGSQTDPHQSPHIKNQRQGRTINQHTPWRLGLSHAVPNSKGAEPQTAALKGLYVCRRCYLALGGLSPQPGRQQMLIAEWPGDKAQGHSAQAADQWEP
jgi:hypothetical protein